MMFLAQTPKSGDQLESLNTHHLYCLSVDKISFSGYGGSILGEGESISYESFTSKLVFHIKVLTVAKLEINQPLGLFS